MPKTKTHMIARFEDGTVLTRSSGSTPSGKPYTHAWRVMADGKLVVSGFSGAHHLAQNAGSAACLYNGKQIGTRKYAVAEVQIVSEDEMRLARGDTPKAFRIRREDMHGDLVWCKSGGKVQKFDTREEADKACADHQYVQTNNSYTYTVHPIWK